MVSTICFPRQFLNFETITDSRATETRSFDSFQQLSPSRLDTTTLPPRIVHAQRPHTQSTTTHLSAHITAHTNPSPPRRICSGSIRLAAAQRINQPLQTAYTTIHHVCSGRSEPPQGRGDRRDGLQVVRRVYSLLHVICRAPRSSLAISIELCGSGWSRAHLLS